MGKLQGKVAIVTGGSSGIGKAGAILFAAEGAKVVIGAIPSDTEKGNGVVAQIRKNGGEAVFIPMDLTKEEDCKGLVDSAISTFGTLDIVYNNAGIDIGKPCLEYTAKDFELTMGVNVFGAFFVGKYAALYMIEQGKPGVIINTGSICSFQTNENNAIYTASKNAVIGMTKALALELAKNQIRVNALCPGYTDTEMSRGYFNSFDDPQAARQEVYDKHPLGRIARPEDLANAALFLASDDSSFVTGTSLLVDGGLLTYFQ